MKLLFKFLAVVYIVGLSACGPETSTDNSTPPTTDPDSTAQTSNDSVPTPSEPSRPTCKLVGSVLEGNMFWAAGEDRFVVISAEKETEDKELGESHRILSVYDGKCAQVFRQVLPISRSADFPYYLSDITYNNVSKQVAIRGFDKFYILDIAAMKLSSAYLPKYLNERYVEDAQSGTIKRMELWENYLVGFAASLGPFVYDLTDPLKAVPVMPLAEFPIVKGEDYNTLFLLKSTEGYQALAPVYDYDKEDFSLNILFEKPKDFNPVINKSFKNNRFILLKERTGGTEGKPHAIDMKTRKEVQLPAEIAAKKDTDVIAWLKTQVN